MKQQNSDNSINQFNGAVRELKRITEKESKDDLKYSNIVKLEIMNLLVSLQGIEREMNQFAPEIYSTELMNEKH